MDPDLRRFYARLAVLRLCRDSLLFVAIVADSGSRWLTRHRLY